MSGLKNIEINPEGLGHALSDKRLAVPIYQRSYAWKPDNVKELFQDYSRAIRDGTEYFLGTIVTAKDTVTQGPASKATNGRPEIVDGQQRLATTTILLAAIRDHFFSNDDKEGARIIEEKYLLSVELDTRVPVPHLKLNEYDGGFFVNYVLEKPDHPGRKAKPERDSHRKIAAAAQIAKKHVADILKGAPRSDHPDILTRWVIFIRDKAQVIWLAVLDYADAYVIFETLNDRGLDLSLADLLKNYLFWKSGDRVHDVQQMWALMTGVLEAVSDDDITTFYIHHLWSSRNGLTRKRDLFRNIRTYITNQQAAIDLIRDLITNAKLYAALRNPDHEYWNQFGGQTRECLRDLQAIRVWQIRILLLAVLGTFSISEAKKVFPQAVAWSVRFMIAGGSPGNLESIYTKCAVRIRKGDIANAKDLAKAMAKEAPEDASFEAQFANARVSFEYIARYLLRKLNETVQPKNESAGLKINSDEVAVNLEHVYPKNPNAETWTHITKDDAEHITNRLGNMAIMMAQANSKLGNADFKTKKVVFAQQPFALTRKLAEYDDTWDLATVDQYQAVMAKVAVRTWQL